MSDRSMLVLSAHPGDFVWRCAGAIALAVSRGERVVIEGTLKLRHGTPVTEMGSAPAGSPPAQVEQEPAGGRAS